MNLASSTKLLIPAILIPILVSVVASYGTWRLVQKPQDDKQESRINATAALNELRAAVDEFQEQEPDKEVPGETVEALREGRRLLFVEERYDDATSRFSEGMVALGVACPDCPSIGPPFDLGG